MKAGIIPKPTWYDAAMACKPFPGALRGGTTPPTIRFKEDWILRRFYRRFPWAQGHEIFTEDSETTLSPGRQFAQKVEKLMNEGKHDM